MKRTQLVHGVPSGEILFVVAHPVHGRLAAADGRSDLVFSHAGSHQIFKELLEHGR